MTPLAIEAAWLGVAILALAAVVGGVCAYGLHRLGPPDPID